jgi:hypothetical protein
VPKRPHKAGCNQRATTVQINANKRKKNCFLLLSFTIVYFLESGLFNSLQAIQIKNFAPSQLASEVVRETSLIPSFSWHAAHKAQRRSGDWESYSTAPGFLKAIAQKSLVGGFLGPIAGQINHGSPGLCATLSDG